MKRLAMIWLIVAAAVLTPLPAGAASYQVIVNKANPIDSITKDDLADIYLKKTTRWRNGRAATPVDQADRNSIRSDFDLAILGKEVAWVKSYWQRMIFSGRSTPPAELSTNAEVVEFVGSNPDAVGYVESGASLGDSVKVLKVTN